MSVTLDSVGPNSGGTSNTGTPTISWSHTIGAGSNRVVYVGVAIGASPDTMTTTATFGGVAMTSIGLVHADNTNAGYVELFRLANPPVGAATVVVTCSATPVSIVGGSASYFNANQVTPETVTTAYGSSASPSITVPVTVGDMAISLVGCGSAVTSTTNTQLWLNNRSGATGCGNAAMSQDTSGVMAWTVASDFWGIIGVDIHMARNQLGLKVEAAFVNDPFASSLTWTDITDHVLSASTNLGRNYETNTNEASTVSLLLRNDGRFNPLNTASPYYPYVLPFRPVRITGLDVIGGSTPVWTGFIQVWPQSWTNQRGVAQVTGVDAFKAVLGFVASDPYDLRVRKDYGVAPGGAGVASSYWEFIPFDEASAPFHGENLNNATALTGVSQPTKISPSPCRTGLSFNGSAGLGVGARGASGELWINPASIPSVPGQAQLILAGDFLVSGTSPTNNMFLLGLPRAMKLGYDMPPGTPGSYGPMSVDALVLLKPFLNLMPSDNSSNFETSIADWTSETPANVTISRSTANPAEGLANLRLTMATNAVGAVSLNTHIPVTAGVYYTATVAMASSRANDGSNLTVAIRWYNSTGTLISTSTVSATNTIASTGTYTQTITAGVGAPAPAGAVTAQVVLTPSLAGGTVGGFFEVDAVSFYGGTSSNASVPQAVAMAYAKPSAGNPAYLVYQSGGSTPGYTYDVFLAPAPTVGQWHLLQWAPRFSSAPIFSIDGVAQTLTSGAGTVLGSAWRGNMQYMGCTASSSTYVAGWEYHGYIAAYYSASEDTGIVNVAQPYAVQHYNYGTTATGAARTHDFPSELTSTRVQDVCTAVGLPSSAVSVETGLTTMTASGDVAGTAATKLLEDAATAELGNVFINQAGLVVFHNRSHRNNILPPADSGFESGLGRWVSGPNWSISDDTSHPLVGSYSMKCVRNNATVGNGYAATSSGSPYPIAANTTYTAVANVYADATTAGKVFTLMVQENLGTAQHSQNFTLGNAGTWTRARITFTTTSSATQAQLFVTDDPQSAPSSGQAIWVDEAAIYLGSMVTFGEGSGEIPYEDDMQTSFDDQYIYNDVQITQEGSSPTYRFEAQDDTSEMTYGVRTLQGTVQCANTSDIDGMAATMLARYKNPLLRVPQIRVELRGKPSYAALVFALNIGDAVTVQRRPVDAPAFTFNAFIDGIKHDVDETKWSVTFMLTPLYPNSTY